MNSFFDIYIHFVNVETDPRLQYNVWYKEIKCPPNHRNFKCASSLCSLGYTFSVELQVTTFYL
jgi:hypothetical protein